MATGDPTFFEIGAPDGDRASAFFAELFGWRSTSMNYGSHLLESPTARLGVHGNDDSRMIGVYISVPDLDEATGKVERMGGKVHPERGNGGEFGRFVECEDDQGVRFGLHQPPDA